VAFAPERLVVGAHVTLFHALPGGRLDAVLLDVAEVAATTEPFPVAITAVRSLGRGVALGVGSAILDRLHANLADRWRPWLTPQDAARFSAHVTIQNKVSPRVARSTLAEIAGDFTPYEALATGLATWRYVGGPWEPVLVTPFPSPGPSHVLRATPIVREPGLSGDQGGPRSPASAGPPRPGPFGIARMGASPMTSTMAIAADRSQRTIKGAAP